MLDLFAGFEMILAGGHHHHATRGVTGDLGGKLVGHFWLVEVGQFSQAPKIPHRCPQRRSRN